MLWRSVLPEAYPDFLFRCLSWADKKHLKDMTVAQVFDTPHRSPQLPLWDLGEGEWLKVIRLAPYAPRRQQHATHIQARLFS